LKFFSELSFGRNFLWKEQLKDAIPEEYLYKNIWKEADPSLEIIDDDYKLIQSCFCNLLASLYIDHDPLHKKLKP